MCDELWIANCWSAGLKEERGAWPFRYTQKRLASIWLRCRERKSQRQRASKELGFSREKNIYKQLAQLATASGATEAIISRMLLFLAFAVCSLHKCKTHYGN